MIDLLLAVILCVLFVGVCFLLAWTGKPKGKGWHNGGGDWYRLTPMEDLTGKSE
jgi:hypothetical protein